MKTTWDLSEGKDWWMREFYAIRIDKHGKPIKLTEADKARGLVPSLVRRSAEARRDAIDEQDRIEEGTA